MKIIEEIRAACAARITLTPKEAQRFFKVSEGSYGAHDAFLGITVPNLRKIAKIYQGIELQALAELLESKYNEERLLVLLILVYQYQKGSSSRQEALCAFYLSKLDCVNNWNLVDSSAHHILGHYLWDRDRSMLTKLAASGVLWERRIAIVATWYFIRKADLDWTFRLAKLLLNDPHDLIHKAVGWMLREAGKKDEARLIAFLSNHANRMPKTMLRYAMERLPKEKRVVI
jgi:3-methyladenine DNA glycosylase AlkD